ncbi:MAG: hypothetical protein GY749_03345 [Desulfobacteraceae bacterium]|nr:hypothetical protein [Desulfobacteraceae bacterium]
MFIAAGRHGKPVFSSQPGILAVPCRPSGAFRIFFRHIAEVFIDVHGSVAIPRSVTNDNRREPEEELINFHHSNQALRWMTFSLPPDLLLGALGTDQGPPSEIRYYSPQLINRLRDRGFAEVHLHIWASLEFPILWVTTLHGLASTELDGNGFQSPGADFDEGRMLAPWLLRAAIARYLLALFLYESTISSVPDFSRFLENVLPEIGRFRGSIAEEIVRRGLMEVISGSFMALSPDYASLRERYRDLARVATFPLPDNPDDVFFADPIAHLVPYRSEKGPTPEILFIHKGISYLNTAPNDNLFAALFWQVVRIRGILYRHMIQRPMTPGLQWFIRTYSRIDPGRRTVGRRFIIKTAAKTCGKRDGLLSLEVRTSPKASSSNIREIAQDFMIGLREDYDTQLERSLSACERNPNREFEFGIVFHFAKLRGGSSHKGFPNARWMGTEADPRKLMPGGLILFQSRYSFYYRRTRTQAEALARLLFNFPISLRVIRGIDVCTDELGVPSWVLVPHLRYIRDAGNAAAQHLQNVHGIDIPELRVTVHTGEDFIHLLGGMRRIDESIRYFKLRPGDRLGHAIALGTDPAVWAERAGHVAMSREDRLFDLSWEWVQYSRDRVTRAAGRLAFIEREIARLTNLIFGEQLSPYQLEIFMHNLHNERILYYNIGYPDCPFTVSNQNTDMELLNMYLTDPHVFEMGQKIEWVNTLAEIDSMKFLQKYLRQRIATLGLVVEVNPSSNLLIGNLADLTNHPLWRMNPPDNNGDTIPVAVCIGSDDPLTFATNLRQEYALLHDALIAGGLSDSQAHSWIEHVRETGLSSRFTCLRVSDINPESDNMAIDPINMWSYHAVGLERNVQPMP